MDADVLRLILLALGATLVVGIYLWDRYKRSRTRLKGLSARKVRKQPVFTSREADMGVLEQQELPHLTVPDEEPQVVPVQLTEDQAIPEDNAPELKQGFSALGEDEAVQLNPRPEDGLPSMVIQIGLVSNRSSYTGEDIRAAMQEVDLHYGEMGIYHRHNKTGQQVLFSVASMVEPGYFPKGSDAGFKTPGLLIFTQLPGAEDGLVIYSDMLYTAERLLALLGGNLQDETHSALSKQQVEHTRDLILEHRRKVQLARMKK